MRLKTEEKSINEQIAKKEDEIKVLKARREKVKEKIQKGKRCR